jgi:DNA repair photolyase
MTNSAYRYAMDVTSQFYYCGLPLRLDTYSRCQFNCLYCFANARGGRRGSRRLTGVDVEKIARRLKKLESENPRCVIDEFLAHRQPIHLGGMADPFVPAESEMGCTLSLLKVFARFNYPVVISTKSDLFATPLYLDAMRAGNFVIQVSISSTDSEFAAKADWGCAEPTRLLAALERVTSAGIPGMCRIQPVHPSREADVFKVMDASSKAGARHVAVEHLKLPLERNWHGTRRLSELLGFDLWDYYARAGAKREGREWILPRAMRLPWMQQYRSYAHSLNLSFGAADNDLLLLSDGRCCCSGVDLLRPSVAYFAHTFTEAVRRGRKKNEITLSLLDDLWCPNGSVAQYINSNSRLPADQGKGRGIRDYIRENWNGALNGNSPMSLFGVVDTGKFDRNGFKIYALSREITALPSQSDDLT